MLKSSSGELVLSATDLTNHLACLHLTHERRKIALGLRGKPRAVDDPHAQLVRERGQAHEAERLTYFVEAAGGSYVDLTAHEGWTIEALQAAAAATEAAMRTGTRLIYQATFFDGRWQGRTDFLRRIDAPSHLGAYAYEVLDTKLAREARPAVVHQLCLYNRLLAEVQGFEPDDAYVVLGTGEEVRIELHRYRALHRHAARRLELVVDGEPEDVYPEPVAHCGFCALDDECSARRRADDHLSIVAGAARDARKKLVGAGIDTVAGLAGVAPGTPVPDLAPERFDVLRHQATLQVESRETHEPTRRQLPPARERGYARLPEPSPGDIFFDLEGDPYVGHDGGIEYLWGWTTVDGTYHCRWAHDEAEEQVALQEFIDFVEAARATHPALHVFHYAHHERGKLATLAQKYGVLESEIDDWLRSGLLVDLYAVVRQGLQVGEESYSLKKLERHHAFERKEKSVREGGGSIIAYENWRETGDATLLEAIRAYNEEDCASTASLFEWLVSEMRPEAALEFEVDFAELAKPEPSEPYEGPAWLPETLALVERLRAGLPAAAADDTAEQAVKRLLGGLLLYHYRESKPQWWEWFELASRTPEELVGEREAVGLIQLDRSVAPIPCKRSLEWTYRFPAQETKLAPGGVVDPATGESHTLARIDGDSLVLRRGKDADPPEPTALIRGIPLDAGPMRKVLQVIAESLLAGEDRYHAALALLRREPPRLLSGELGPDTCAADRRNARPRPIRPPDPGAARHGQDLPGRSDGCRGTPGRSAGGSVRRQSRGHPEPAVHDRVARRGEHVRIRGCVQGRRRLRELARPDRAGGCQFRHLWRRLRAGRRDVVVAFVRTASRAIRHALHRRGRAVPARQRRRRRRMREQHRAAGRSAATAPGHAGHASRRRRRVGARAPARRARHRATRARRPARRNLADASRCLRVRLRAQLRGQAAFADCLRAAPYRRPWRDHRSRPAHARRRAQRAQSGLPGGGGGHRRRLPRAARRRAP